MANTGGRRKTVIGMVGLKALPGTYMYQGESVEEIKKLAVEDAIKLCSAGFDGIIIQNVNDLPGKRKVGPEIVAYMASIGQAIRTEVGRNCLLGVSVLKNDGEAGVAIAHAIEADFVRLKVYVGAMVSAEGLIEGCMEEVLEMKKRIGAQVELWADVLDRTGRPLTQVTVEEMAEQAFTKGGADAVIVTGRSFEETLKWIETTRRSVPGRRILVGGGCTPNNVGAALEYADGIIVGTYLKRDGCIYNSVDDSRVLRFMKAVTAARDAK
ncbi:BtpA/SgcQ family protein [Thermanaeromonas sp. C210]|uniref:BtpA/SgcQ family protein n=1 Tax=Thermanaeromonas sp. C210 TaxID=2731925 RepID=UPI00155D4CE3|nr:BtpA/SgcQ family protein [Thermanaeromonas sp. C210]GFN22357.1 hypothetical protein TAMC210_06730 [Thermanaeromonas sp. C210]